MFNMQIPGFYSPEILIYWTWTGSLESQAHPNLAALICSFHFLVEEKTLSKHLPLSGLEYMNAVLKYGHFFQA